MLWTILLFLIFVLIIRAVWEVVFPFLIVPALGLQKNLKRFCGGEWAVVTGATDGIGKAYAKQLAQAGYNVLLVSRSQERLEATAAEIEACAPQSTVRICQMDLSKIRDEASFHDLRKQLQELDVGILVNNVGVSLQYPELLDQVPDADDFARNALDVNCLVPTQLLQSVLPQMRARRSGVVINISSAAGVFPAPLLSVYSASKAFLGSLSAAVGEECRQCNVSVQCVYPFFVATKMSGIRRPSFWAPSPEDFVASALKTVGFQRHTFGCLSHSLQGFLGALTPTRFHLKYSHQLLAAVRAKALRKLQQPQ